MRLMVLLNGLSITRRGGEADLRVMDLSRSFCGDSHRERVGLLEQERFLDERLGRLDERLRRGLRRMEAGRLSGLRVGDP